MVLYENQIQISNENQELDNELKRNIVYISPIRHAEGGLFLNNVLDNPDLYEEMLDILKDMMMVLLASIMIVKMKGE